ncbi:MAG: hypothetical protein KA886_03020 [Candidatus Cloacimonetes bacterium]|nr:hypothetical protein [Candidatus Cloacimonadota bacterium]
MTNNTIFEETSQTLNILLNVEKSFMPKAEYIFRTFCRILGLSPSFEYNYAKQEVHIYYGTPTSRDYPVMIHHNPEAVNFFYVERNEQKKYQIPVYDKEKVNFFKYGKEYIPFLFSPQGPIFFSGETSIRINKDIIASAFYFLTCWQEYADDKEMFPGDRYDYKSSLQYYWNFTELPVVDRYCHMFELCLEYVLKKFSKQRKWPNKSLFALTISHDIDYWEFWSKDYLDSMIQFNKKRISTKPLKSLYKIVGHWLTKSFFYSPEGIMKKIKRIENLFYAKSTFFLLAGSQTLDKRQEYFFNPQIRTSLKTILEDNEIGLHGTKTAAFDQDTINEEFDNLKTAHFDCQGYRNHYLSFDYQKSFAILENAGFEYDSTLGFWENIGYRAGISFPFFPYNLKENKTFKILEIPLIVMDTTLYSEKAMKMSVRKSFKHIKRMIQLSRNNCSHLSILWHNTIFDSIDYPGWGKLYYRILRYAYKNDAWICSLKELRDFWLEN